MRIIAIVTAGVWLGLVGQQAWAGGFSYKAAEDFKTRQYKLKIGVQVSGEKGRYELAMGDYAGPEGTIEEQTAKATAGSAGVGSQMGMERMGAGMEAYMAMAKTPEQKAMIAKQMAAMKGAYASPAARAAEEANTQHTAQGAGAVAKEVSAGATVSILDLKAKTNTTFTVGMPNAAKKYSTGRIGAAKSSKTGWGWETATARVSAGKPKAAKAGGRSCMLHTVKLVGTLVHPTSKESNDFKGELRFWMDPSQEGELGAAWRSYEAARRKAGYTGVSLRENFDAGMYMVLTPEARAQFDKILGEMEGTPVKVHYRIEGRALKYRIAGDMKAAMGDMGMDLAEATDSASAGDESGAAGPEAATNEDPWELEASLSHLAAAEPGAGIFRVPAGYEQGR